jgi:hypothetical protein
MSTEHVSEEKKSRIKKPEPDKLKAEAKEKNRPTHEAGQAVSALQSLVGNRAVQRLLAQRSGNAPFELDDSTANRIDQQRGSGQSLDNEAGEKLGGAMGVDFSDVRVHTTPESNQLNQELGARAFTTGQDIFFNEGEYQPQSSAGQELLAHELTHVVQQGTGEVSGASRMTVNAPGDTYEQQADDVANSVMSAAPQASVQRDPLEEEQVQMEAEDEEELQMQEMDEEELQMQEMDEEELQMQVEEEEEVQKEALPEEEEVQAKRKD